MEQALKDKDRYREEVWGADACAALAGDQVNAVFAQAVAKCFPIDRAHRAVK